jgi:chromosome partitioning protein
MIILVGSNKGGCGKSTTVINLAIAYAKQSREVLIIDADRQSTASRWSNDREYYQLTPYIQVLQKYDNLQPALNQIKSKYDVILVDVAGRNSRELLSAMLAADLLICPLQCSQPDLDTLAELKEQVIRAADLNPKLKTYIYHTMASTNTKVKDNERKEFIDYISQYEDFKVLNAVNYFRKIYKDAMSEGKSVLELSNDEAVNEITQLYNEVENILSIK